MSKRKCLLIEKDVLVELLREKYQSACIILLLEYLCSKLRIETVLSAEEVCRVLDFDPGQLENARRTRRIKGVIIGDKCYYPVSGLAMLPEQRDRAKIMQRINKIPVIELDATPEPA